MYNDDYDGKPKTTLLQNNISEDMKQIESKLLALHKKLDALKDYIKQIIQNNYKYNSQNFSDINDLIKESKRLDEEITDLLEGLNQYDLNQLRDRQKIFDKKNQFSRKLDDYRNDLAELTKSIHSKEIQSYNQEYENGREIVKDIDPIIFDDNRVLMVEEINTNKERMGKRTKDLEDIKMVSAQLNSIASQFKTDVYQQGERLNSIEDNVVDVKQNTVKSEDAIKQADELSKRTRKKMIWIIVIIAFIAISAAVLSYLIYSNTTS